MIKCALISGKPMGLMHEVIILSLVVSFLSSSGFCQAGEGILLKDDFESYNIRNWGPKPATAITVQDGKLIDKPQTGQVYISSLKKFKHVTLEMKVKFNRLSTNSTIFYYLGFQSMMPWTYNTCWVTIQDAGLFVSANKDGEKGVREYAADINEGRWYIFKIVWKESLVEYFLDGELIYKIKDESVIPEAKMPVFLSANTLQGGATPAEMEIDQVTVKKVFSASAGTPPGVSIQAKESLVLENQCYLCEVSTINGLRLERIFNKKTRVEYLYPDGNSPLFLIRGKKLSLDSRDFIVKDIKLDVQRKAGTAEIFLVSANPQIEACVKFEINSSDRMLWSLRLKNNDTDTIKMQPIFPVIARVNIDGSLGDNQYFFPWRSGIEGGIDCDLTAEYGNLAWMQVIALFNPKAETGIFTYPKDKTGSFKGLILRKFSPNPETMVREQEIVLQYEVPKEGVFDFEEGIGLAYYYPEREIVAGAEYNLPDTVVSIYKISVYQGGWKQPLEDYSSWAHTWYRHVGTPQWFKNCFSFMVGHPQGFYSEKEHKYIYSQKLTGTEHITQWAMWNDCSPQSTGRPPFTMARYENGNFNYNQHRGGLKTFKEEIQRCQAKGTRFTVYINHRFLWEGTEMGKKFGEKWAAMNRPGKYTTYQGERWCECYYEPNAWADYLAKSCGRIVRETGMDGIYLDELMIGFPCYNPNHPHYQQDHFPYNHKLLLQHAIKARQAMRKENPEAILMTEHAGSDYYTQFFDGSWSQTFYQAGFPFSEKYYDSNSLVYFRFCFPEFKLAEWGESPDQVRRCFFNGIGRCGGFGGKINQLLKENGDAFASLTPEPLVKTRVKNVLANKFPTASKTIYTIYNKSGKEVNQEVIEVDHKPGYHYVELLNDNEVPSRLEPVKIKDALTFLIEPSEVLCIGQLPKIIKANREGKVVKISLTQVLPDATLYAFLDFDTSHTGFSNAVKITLKSGQGELDLLDTFGRKGKLILKLYQEGVLFDEVVQE